MERDREFDFVVTRRSSDDQPASDALNKDAIADAEDGGVTLGDAGRIFFSGGRVGIWTGSGDLDSVRVKPCPSETAHAERRN